jgi:hypothetical protein
MTYEIDMTNRQLEHMIVGDQDVLMAFYYFFPSYL